MKPATARSLTDTVSGNTVWYTAELSLSIVSALLTSIPIARMLGPVKLSYFIYLQWLTNTGGSLAMLGIPMTTRKYMAEYLARGDRETAWAIFRSGMLVQGWISAAVLAFGFIAASKFVDPGYRTILLLLVACVAFKLVACIPSSANSAAENLRANFFGAAANGIVSVTLVNISLRIGWGLMGVAASLALGMGLELLVKTALTLNWLARFRTAVLSADLRRKMYRFSGEGLFLMIVQMVVWDRSDLVFLKWLDRDPRQVTFFGVAFNLVDKILFIPQSFGQVVGVSVMAEYGRNRERLSSFVSTALTYGLLVSVPFMIGSAAISSPLIRLLYGKQYIMAIPVLALGAALAVFKPLLAPLQSHLQAEDRQRFLIVWTIVCAAINVVLDITLIPWLGARGAIVANGVAQTLAIAGIWFKVARMFAVSVPVATILKIFAAGIGMAAAVWRVDRLPLPPAVQLLIGIPLGGLVYLLSLKALRVLDNKDGNRLEQAARRLPAGVGALAAKGCRYLVARA